MVEDKIGLGDVECEVIVGHIQLKAGHKGLEKGGKVRVDGAKSSATSSYRFQRI